MHHLFSGRCAAKERVFDISESGPCSEGIVHGCGYGRCNDRCGYAYEFGEAARGVEPDITGTVDSDGVDMLNIIVESVARAAGEYVP